MLWGIEACLVNPQLFELSHELRRYGRKQYINCFSRIECIILINKKNSIIKLSDIIFKSMKQCKKNISKCIYLHFSIPNLLFLFFLSFLL